MKDNLEKYIFENREEFDIHEPPAGMWEKIEKNVSPKKKIKLTVIITRVAAVLLIFIASYFVHDFIDDHGSFIAGKDQKKKEVKMPEIPELKEAEIYYSSLINQKMNEIKPVFAENPSIEKEIRYDLNQLDSVYNSLKLDLKDNIANQEIVEAMIQNYRLRLSILEDVLMMIKPDEHENTKNNDYYDL